MITEEKTFSFTDSYLRAAGADPGKCVIFDIETTGFRAASSHLYLIGAAVRVSPDVRPAAGDAAGTSLWKLTQWLSEKPQEEAELLRAFRDSLPEDAVFVHFNGDRFDIPYMNEKYDRYGISSPFEGRDSVDLFRSFRNLKGLLGMEHMKLTDIEHFLRLRREDRYDGGKLIGVYRSFCGNGDPSLRELLLLHNREDVEGTLKITPMQSYLSLLDKAAKGDPGSADISVSENGVDLELSFELPLPVPAPVRATLPQAEDSSALIFSEKSGLLRVPVYEGTLLYFFADYKDYWYLPFEDEAIHKSVAQFVDRDRRVPATRETCYIRRSGRFIPQTDRGLSRAMRRSYKDKENWIPLDEAFLNDPESLRRYVCAAVVSAFK